MNTLLHPVSGHTGVLYGVRPRSGIGFDHTGLLIIYAYILDGSIYGWMFFF